jgi:hypothetical protein
VLGPLKLDEVVRVRLGQFGGRSRDGLDLPEVLVEQILKALTLGLVPAVGMDVAVDLGPIVDAVHEDRDLGRYGDHLQERVRPLGAPLRIEVHHLLVVVGAGVGLGVGQVLAEARHRTAQDIE